MNSIYKRFSKRTLLFLLIVHLSILSFATNYYVSNAGNDSNNGLTTTQSWKTLGKVNSFTFKAGDKILFNKGNTWAEALTIPSSGTSGSPIVFSSYGSGAMPIITGSDSRDYCISTNNKSYITIDGLNLVHALGSNYDYGALKIGTATVVGIVIKNCTIENNRKTGIALAASSSALSIKIDSCIVRNNGMFGILNSGDFTTGQISNCQINGNGTYTDADSQQTSNIQGDLGNLDIFGNTIYNAAPGSVTYNAQCHGIYVSTPSPSGNYANIHNNIIYGNTTGAGIKCRYNSNIYNNLLYGNQGGQIVTGGNLTTNATYNIHNNIIFNSINGYGSITEDAKGSGTLSLNIYNNTLYKTGNAYASTTEIYVANNITSLSIKNNILYGADDHGGINIAVTQSNAVIDYNLYWKDVQSDAVNNYYNGTKYTSLVSWKALGFDAHGVNQNPLLVNPITDYHLKSTSPAINVGINVGLSTDCEGNSILGLPDIGAYEYASTTDSEKPVVTEFSIPSTSTSQTVSISSFTASDNIGVTGYLLTETSTTPSSSAAGWSTVKSTTYTFSSIGAKTLYAWAKDAAGNVSASKSASVTISAPVASTFTFTGPSSGNVNSPSANFTVTPNNVYTGTITITPSGTGSVGLSAKVLTFSNSSTAQTFSITPIVAGSITLMPTNNATLTNPANLIYTANAILPNAPTSVVATAGDASALVTFVAPTNTGGSAITGYTVTSIPAGGVDTNAGSTSLTHSIVGLTNGTSYTFTVKANNSVGSSVASIASNSISPKVADVITKQGDIIPSHFKTVWEGLNGLNHMNINVVSATLEDVPLSVDDEIAVFSGSKCVGTTKLTKTIVSSDNTTFLSILASQDDGSGNGFSENDTIVFKIWDSKTQSELQVNGVVYRNDVSTWKTNGKYSPAATAVVEIASYNVITQSIELLKGYNMISTYVSVQNPNVSAVTKSLQDQGSLIKMQDETGNSLENWGNFGGWINQLGSMEETEGYKIQVANNCTLQVTGRSIVMPFDISLKTGWNIISYPRTDVVNAMNVFQALIDQNKLVKVQDEAGNSIENWGLFGGWKNGIGNLIPGKAYKVKISADAILTFQESYPKSAVVLAKAEETEYYHSSVEGNGTDHMNINITGLNTIGVSVGDEIAAFDGALCVATTKITEANVLSGSVSLASSFSTNDQNPDGFKVGDQIQISTWSKLSGDESKVNTEVITGQMKYEKNATVLVKMKSATIATAITNLNDAVKIDVFPNPCQDQVTIRFSKIPEVDSRIEISDISGRKLITRPISGNTEEINLDSFTPGLYLVKSILGKNEYVQKLIVNK